MLNCREATRLCSEQRDRRLSVGERIALRLHTLICAHCTNFHKQLDFLSRATRQFREGRRPDDEG